MQPPGPPPPQLHQQEPSQPQPPRAPVIIYTVSPKIIHTHRDNFMALVQRLTGKTSTSTITSSSSPSTSIPNNMSPSTYTSTAFDAPRGSVSTAARHAAMEKANASNGSLGFVGGVETTDQYYHHRQNPNPAIERSNLYPSGVLSPDPTSLPVISQGSPSFFNDFNSILQTSPSTTPSPSSMDRNNFFDS